MWASVREIGTEIYWDDCDMDGDEVDDQGVTCNVWENEDELNCKLRHNETGISNSSLAFYLAWIAYICIMKKHFQKFQIIHARQFFSTSKSSQARSRARTDHRRWKQRDMREV